MAKTINNFKFCPYEDVLGIGTSSGFTSIIVPGKLIIYTINIVIEQLKILTERIDKTPCERMLRAVSIPAW